MPKNKLFCTVPEIAQNFPQKCFWEFGLHVFIVPMCYCVHVIATFQTLFYDLFCYPRMIDFLNKLCSSKHDEWTFHEKSRVLSKNWSMLLIFIAYWGNNKTIFLIKQAVAQLPDFKLHNQSLPVTSSIKWNNKLLVWYIYIYIYIY